MTTSKDFQNMDKYIKNFPSNIQKMLEQIRQTIHAIVPEATEVISYQMPAFKLNGRVLIYFAAWKEHVGLYPVTAPMLASIKELANYETSGKGTVRFPFTKPLPLSLIRKMVKFQVNNLKKI
jgi:uncharacterized protein YdhG (YjbR/CyaY superfamily)